MKTIKIYGVFCFRNPTCSFDKFSNTSFKTTKVTQKKIIHSFTMPENYLVHTNLKYFLLEMAAIALGLQGEEMVNWIENNYTLVFTKYGNSGIRAFIKLADWSGGIGVTPEAAYDSFFKAEFDIPANEFNEWENCNA